MSAAYVRPRAVIRINSTPDHPRPMYVRRVGRNAGFVCTYDKAKARQFLPATAAALARALQTDGNTRFTFDTCEAPNDAA